MSTREWITVTVRGHDVAREAAVVAAVQRWVADEGLASGWDWHAPRVVPARDGAREVQVDSKDAVTLRDAVTWQDRADRELPGRVAAANGGACACTVSIDDTVELRDERRARTCDAEVVDVLRRVWNDDPDSPSFRPGDAARNAAMAAAFGLLPDDERRTAWALLVATPAAASDPALATALREFLRGPVGHVSTSAWWAHVQVLSAFTGSRDLDESLGGGSVERCEALSRRVADGATVVDALRAERLARGEGLGRAITWKGRAPFLEVDGQVRLYDLTDETVGLRDWLVERGRMPPPPRDVDGIPLPLLADLLRAAARDRLPPGELDAALAGLTVQPDHLEVDPSQADAWLAVVRPLCEDPALAERALARATGGRA